MNSTPTIQPPASKPDTGDHSDEIFLRINIPTTSSFTPDKNHIGALLLKHLIAACLQAGNIAAKEIHCAGSLNNCVFIIRVSLVRKPALDAIQTLLEGTGILSHSKLGWLDPRIKAVRLVYPNADETLELDPDELIALVNGYNEDVAALGDFVRQFPKPGETGESPQG